MKNKQTLILLTILITLILLCGGILGYRILEDSKENKEALNENQNELNHNEGGEDEIRNTKSQNVESESLDHMLVLFSEF